MLYIVIEMFKEKRAAAKLITDATQRQQTMGKVVRTGSLFLDVRVYSRGKHSEKV